MNIPSINVGVKVEPAGGKVTVMKEFSGGIQGEYEVELPAVFGIQTARSPPPYMPGSKIRKASKEATINEVEDSVDSVVTSQISKYLLPETGEGAQMIEGELEEQVEKIFTLLQEKGFK